MSSQSGKAISPFLSDRVTNNVTLAYLDLYSTSQPSNELNPCIQLAHIPLVINSMQNIFLQVSIFKLRPMKFD